MVGGFRLAGCAWLGLACLAFAPGPSAPAAEPFTSKHGFRLRPPAGENWQPVRASYMPEPDFAIEDPASGRRFLVFVFGRDFDEYEWDLSAVTNLTWTIRRTFAADNPAGARAAFEGLPAYECRAHIVRNNADGWICVTAILTSRCRYWIVREKAPGDPAADADLEALRLGFQFTEPPSPPPPRPKAPAWGMWAGGGAIAAALALIAFLLVRSLRGKGRNRTKRSRYVYSEKAQELAGKPAGGGGKGSQARCPTVSPDFRPPEIGRAMRPSGGGAQFLITAIVNWLTAPTRDPKSTPSGSKSNAAPLKLDRRFLKDDKREKPGEEKHPGEGRQ